MATRDLFDRHRDFAAGDEVEMHNWPRKTVGTVFTIMAFPVRVAVAVAEVIFVDGPQMVVRIIEVANEKRGE